MLREIGRGVNIAAAPDRILWQERGGMVSQLVVMRRPEAAERNYQSEGHVTLAPGVPQKIEVNNLNTHRPFTRTVGTHTDVLYVGPLDERAMADIENASQSACFKDSKRNGPMVEIFPGVFAELFGIREGKANRLTTSEMNHRLNPYAIVDPRLAEGRSIGLHFDNGDGLPISTRIQEPRRFVVNMTPGTIHYSLIVPEYNVFDLSAISHSKDAQYIPNQPELYTELAAQSVLMDPDRINVVWTPLACGEAVLLPAYTIIHDGSSHGQESSRIAILHEPARGWSNDAFRAYTLFDNRSLERQGYDPLQRAELAQMAQMAAVL